MKKTRPRLKVQFLVFIGLFILAEIALRIYGMKAGALIDDFKVEDKPVYQARFISDEMGINHIVADSNVLMLGSVINRQGFRGNFDYTRPVVDSIKKNTGKEVLMLIGDSFVEGCCADSVTNSFPDIVGRNPAYEVLNFGVAGTDPLQYALIAKKYVKELKPNKVVVLVYLGNDIIISKRIPSPGIPLTYPFKNNKWLYSIAPDNLSGQFNYILKDPEEAYGFYLRHYTLKDENRNFFEKAMAVSVILSKIYLATEHWMATRNWQKKNPGLHIDVTLWTYENLKKIELSCKNAGIPCLFAAIPAPNESLDEKKIKEKYNRYFKDIEWFVPEGFEKEDYDGTSIGNHFNNQGHIKYAKFLRELLLSTKKQNAN